MHFFLHYLAPFGISMLIVIVLTPVWISICRKWHLFDEPDGRKHHKHLIPSMGGIAIFAGLFIAYLSFAQISDPEKIRYFFGASLILFFTGFFDDLMDVPAKNKLLLQMGSAIIVFAGGYRIEGLNDILGIGSISVYLQFPLTLLLIVGFTNAFNFIDGIDGLAASLGLLIMIVIGYLFLQTGKYDYAILCFCMCGALSGFLIFNISPAKIFMGDTGSLIIGFMSSVMIIELWNTGGAASESLPATIILAILFVPFFDIGRVMAIRFLNGVSPFTPDRSHIHHLITGYGFGHTFTTLLIVALSISLIFLGYLLRHFDPLLFLIAASAWCMLFLNRHIMMLFQKIRSLIRPEWKSGMDKSHS